MNDKRKTYINKNARRIGNLEKATRAIIAASNEYNKVLEELERMAEDAIRMEVVK